MNDFLSSSGLHVCMYMYVYLISGQHTCVQTSHTSCPQTSAGRMAVFPNLLGHQSQDWTEQFILGDLKQLEQFSCSPHLLTFGCALLNPPCATDNGVLSPVPPCRELCTCKHVCLLVTAMSNSNSLTYYGY